MEMAAKSDRRQERVVLSAQDQEFLNSIRKKFGDHVQSQKGSHTYLTREKLGKFLKIRDSYLAGNLFRVMDTDGDGRLSESDVSGVVSAVILGSDQKKLRFIFDVHDADGNGEISREELGRMFKAVLRHSKLKITPRIRLEVESALFEQTKGKPIDFSAFRKLLSRDGAVRKTMLSSMSTWFGREPDKEAAAGRPGLSTILRYIFVVIPYYVWWDF